VSIGKRLANLVRSNLNAVLDRTAGKLERTRGAANIEDLTDEELEAELVRRRQRRTAAERAADATGGESYSADDWDEVERAVGDTGRYRTTRRTGAYRRAAPGARRGPSVGSPSMRDPRLAQLYAQLECPYGSDMTTVRKHYRALMRKYHPDMHSESPEKLRVATDLSQRLTAAYNELRRLLSTNTPPG
jgi:DnaJ-domain-containing protein 1